MAQENVDPVYGYIDEKIEFIKSELQQPLLELQQLVAVLKVNSDTNDIVSIIENTQLSNKLTIKTQILTEASAIKQKIITSASPLQLAGEFHEKWVKVLHDKGADFISY